MYVLRERSTEKQIFGRNDRLGLVGFWQLQLISWSRFILCKSMASELNKRFPFFFYRTGTNNHSRWRSWSSWPCSQKITSGPYPLPLDASPLSHIPKWVPCHHSMAGPQVADGRTASSYGVYLRIHWIINRGQTTKSGPPIWGLGMGLTTLRHKK
jgi:hypothetical protein